VTAARLRGGVRTVDGCRLVHLTEGEGPHVVFAHGGLGRGSAWLAVADLLCDRWTCHLLDQRAHGASDWGGGPDVGVAAADLLHAVRALGPVRAVVGHSYGALVALEAARLAAPGEVPCLIVYEPPLPVAGPIMDDGVLAALEAHVAVGDLDEALQLHLGSAGGGLSAAEIEGLRTLPVMRATYADLVVQAPSIAPAVRAANALGDVRRYASVDAPTGSSSGRRARSIRSGAPLPPSSRRCPTPGWSTSPARATSPR
jgi:pimeloyl-ACP methyl ester carboxylesterase